MFRRGKEKEKHGGGEQGKTGATPMSSTAAAPAAATGSSGPMSPEKTAAAVANYRALLTKTFANADAAVKIDRAGEDVGGAMAQYRNVVQSLTMLLTIGRQLRADARPEDLADDDVFSQAYVEQLQDIVSSGDELKELNIPIRKGQGLLGAHHLPAGAAAAEPAKGPVRRPGTTEKQTRGRGQQDHLQGGDADWSRLCLNGSLKKTDRAVRTPG